MAGTARLVQWRLCDPCPAPPSVGISQSLQMGESITFYICPAHLKGVGCYIARGSGHQLTYRGNLWFNLVAKRSTSQLPNWLKMGARIFVLNSQFRWGAKGVRFHIWLSHYKYPKGVLLKGFKAPTPKTAIPLWRSVRPCTAYPVNVRYGHCVDECWDSLQTSWPLVCLPVTPDNLCMTDSLFQIS